MRYKPNQERSYKLKSPQNKSNFKGEINNIAMSSKIDQTKAKQKNKTKTGWNTMNRRMVLSLVDENTKQLVDEEGAEGWEEG